MTVTLTIRNLNADVGQRLKNRAAANNRSMEAEARAIIGDAVGNHSFVDAWLDAMEPFSLDELPLPARSLPRAVDFDN